MAKKFNITGACFPAQHYMADTSRKFDRIRAMVEAGDYFVINRPRQYGKTTLLFQLSKALNRSEDWMAFNLSFEGIGDAAFQKETAFSQSFLRQMARFAELLSPELSAWIKEAALRAQSLEDVSAWITELVRKTNKKVVLLIDEVDKSSNNQLFISFLGVLRNKYLDRNFFPTFHSVVLAGVHDVKTLKSKIRPEADQKYNSPWNIAADFKVDMNLQPNEIQPMLEEYAADRQVETDAPAVAARLFHYTAGYPFLVSKLCKMFDEEILPEKTVRAWTTEDVDAAAGVLITETNTIFDSLIKNLENYPELYNLTWRIVVEAEAIPFVQSNPTISLGRHARHFQGGRRPRHSQPHIRRFISSYMSSKLLTGADSHNITLHAGAWIGPGNRLDLEKDLE